MGERFTGWYRNAGDVDASPALRDLAKKLLGELATRQRLGAPPTLVLRRRTPEGFVEAAFIDGMPRVRITATGDEEENPLLAAMEGFIVRPSPTSDQYDNLDMNNVLLEHRGQDKWTARFYDASHLPSGYTLPHGYYKHPFINGLRFHGVVDWRNADQSVIISFHGPACRYFRGGDPGDFAPFVYFKGLPILDVRDLIALVPDLPSPVVRGACLRAGALLVCVGDSSDFTYTEYLLKLPVAVPKLPANGKWQEAASIIVGITGAEVLASRTMDAAVFDRGHPWMFNQSGTEARCIRYNDTQVLECVLAPDAITGAWTYTEIANARPTTTLATSLTRTVLPKFGDIVGAQDGLAWTSADGTTVDSVSIEAGTPSTSYYSQLQDIAIVTDVTASETITVTSPYVLAAVDFRDDVPVYADAILTTRETALTQTRSAAFSESVFETVSGLALDGASSCSFTHVQDRSITSSSHLELSRTSTEHGGTGIRTDWAEVRAETVWTTSLTADAGQDVAYHVEQDFTNFALDASAADKRTAAPPFDNYAGGTFPGYVSSAFHDETASGTSTQSSTLVQDTVTQYIAIGALDLRYKLLVYARVSNHIAFDTTRSDPLTISDVYSFFWSGSSSIVDRRDGSTWTAPPAVPAYTRPYDTVDTPVNTVGVFGVLPLFDVNDDWGDRGLTTGVNVLRWSADVRGRGVLVGMVDSYAYDYVDLSDFVVTYPTADGLPTFTTPAESTSGSYLEAVPDIPSIGYLLRSSSPGVVTTFADFYGDPSAEPVGSWQVYKNAYCYSMARFNKPTLSWQDGLGVGATVSEHTITELTGATGAQVRFNPVSILPKTTRA